MGITTSSSMSQLVGVELRDGALIENKGPVHIIKGLLLVHMQLGDELLMEYAQRIKHEAQAIRVTCHDYLDHTKYITSPKVRPPPVMRNRTKRGLIDIGGRALQVLFGTATEKQLEALAGRVNVQAVEIEKAHKNTKILHDALGRYQEMLNKTAQEQRNVEKDYRLKSWANSLMSLCSSYNAIMTKARQGQIDIDLFDTTKINDAIHQFTKLYNIRAFRLPQDVDFGKSIKVHAVGPNQIILTVMFIGDESYTYFKVQSFPMRSNVTQKYKFALTLPEDSTIILGPKTFGKLTPFELDKCEKIVRKLPLYAVFGN